MSDILSSVLNLPFLVARIIGETVEQLVLAAFELLILAGIFWGIDRLTRKRIASIENSQWWRQKFGYRYSVWDIVAIGIIGIMFFGPVVVVAAAFATGNLPR